jgi:hypothetical protein
MYHASLGFTTSAQQPMLSGLETKNGCLHSIIATVSLTSTDPTFCEQSSNKTVCASLAGAGAGADFTRLSRPLCNAWQLIPTTFCKDK